MNCMFCLFAGRFSLRKISRIPPVLTLKVRLSRLYLLYWNLCWQLIKITSHVHQINLYILLNTHLDLWDNSFEFLMGSFESNQCFHFVHLLTFIPLDFSPNFLRIIKLVLIPRLIMYSLYSLCLNFLLVKSKELVLVNHFSFWSKLHLIKLFLNHYWNPNHLGSKVVILILEVLSHHLRLSLHPHLINDWYFGYTLY